jgi:thymidylate synthase (FAD)
MSELKKADVGDGSDPANTFGNAKKIDISVDDATSKEDSKIGVLGGFVRLDVENSVATDLSVVNSARVSFGKRKEKLEAADISLIDFLIKNRHGTPTEHNSFTFHIRCPIFVAREWFRHRIGSFNEFSMRYSQVKTHDYYVPSLEDVRTQVGKPGSYTFKPMDKEKAAQVQTMINECAKHSFEAYDKMIAMGVAKELARCILPVGAYTEFYWTVNARSLMNFLSLRNHPTALIEIQKYAAAVEHFFQLKMPHTHAAFQKNNRTPP